MTTIQALSTFNQPHRHMRCSEPTMKQCPECNGNKLDDDGRDCVPCDGTGEVEMDEYELDQRARDAHDDYMMQRWKDGEIAINGRFRGQK